MSEHDVEAVYEEARQDLMDRFEMLLEGEHDGGPRSPACRELVTAGAEGMIGVVLARLNALGVDLSPAVHEWRRQVDA